MLQRESPEDALSATQPAASFADEGFALCRRHSEVAKGTMYPFVEEVAAKTVSVREMRYASSLEPVLLSSKAFHALCRYQSSRRRLRYQAPPMGGVRDGRIAYIGSVPPAPDVAATFGETYDGTGTSAHARALQRPCPCSHDASARLPAENLPLQRWLEEKCSPFEAKMTAEDCYWGTVLACAEMARFGVVSFSDMYYATEERARAVLEAGMKANMCEGLVAFEEKPYAEYPICAQMEALVRDWHWGRRRTHSHRL